MRRTGILVSGVLFSLALLAAGPAVAQSGGAGKKNTERRRQELHDRAQARCKANRGVDCDTDAGLQEWIAQ
jgi:hypothetical protein